jgi:hypothetical protein
MATKPDYGWYGAGWASFKGAEVADIHMPPLDSVDALTAWLEGFFAAFAEYPDAEAMAGILEGDYTKGESPEDALFSIAPEIYAVIADMTTIKDRFELHI